MRPTRPPRGLTLVELLATLVIVGMLGALALPAFGGLVERYRARRAIEDLGATLYLARSEAIRRGGRVVLRKQVVPGCVASEPKDWSCGWVLFVDTDNDGVADEGEVTISLSPPTPGVLTTANLPNPPTRIKFNQWGRFNESIGAYSFRAAPVGGDESNGRTLCIFGTQLRFLPGSGRC